MARRNGNSAVAEPEASEVQASEAIEDQKPALTATGYDANGEAVDTRAAQAGLPGVEGDREVELFEGRPVTAWKYSFTGNAPVSMLNDAAIEMFNGMRAEKEFIALVTVVPGSVSYKPNTEDGHVVGFTRERKLHITHMFPKDSSGEALFEGGVMRVRRDAGDDGIGFLTQEPPIPDDDNPLAASLAEAMPIEPGMCGETHEGHLNPCRQPSHACPLRGS